MKEIELPAVAAGATMLIRRGLLQKMTGISARNQRGQWWNSGTSHMNKVVRKNGLEQGERLSLSTLNYFHRNTG